MERTLVILGAGGHGNMVAEAAVTMQRWNTIVYFDDSPENRGERCSHDVLGTIANFMDNSGEFSNDTTDCIVAIGDNTIRTQFGQKLKKQNLALATIIHADTSVSPTASIGIGSVILARAMIGSNAQLGSSCIVNNTASVNHDCELGESVHISPNVAIGGNVLIGSRSWIGIGSSVKQGIHIGKDVTVGAGAAVVSDIDSEKTFVGNPAREIVYNSTSSVANLR